MSNYLIKEYFIFSLEKKNKKMDKLSTNTEQALNNNLKQQGTRILEIANLFLTNLIYLVKLTYFILSGTLGCIICFINQKEKSVYNQIVLITGSAGYLGTIIKIQLTNIWLSKYIF